jgi:hypothetical protein
MPPVGDTLTTRIQGTPVFPPLELGLQLLGGGLDHVNLRSAKRVDERGAGHSGDLGSFALRDQAAIAPKNRRGKAKLAREFSSEHENSSSTGSGISIVIIFMSVS